MNPATKQHWSSETAGKRESTVPEKTHPAGGRYVTEAERGRHRAAKQAREYTTEFMRIDPLAATAKLEGWDRRLERFVHEIAFTQAQVIQQCPHVSLPAEDALWPLHGGGGGWNGGVQHRFVLDAVSRAKKTRAIAISVPGWFHQKAQPVQHHSGAYDR